MKKKNFLSGIGAKLALLTLAISGALMTGCYKDSSIDAPKPGEPVVLPEASYTISGSVIDAKTGANITDATLSVQAEVATTNNINNGVYTVKVNKFSADRINVNLTFTAPGYNEGNAITRTVSLAQIKDGETATYPLSVAMMPNKTPEKNKLVKYEVKFNIKDVTDDKDVSNKVKVVEPAQPFLAEGGTTFTVRTNETDEYKAQTTSVTLPKTYVEDNSKEEKYEVTIYVSPKEGVVPEPDETIYSTISGSVTDKNGKAVLAEIKLVKVNSDEAIQSVNNANTFNFTLNSKEHTSEYEIVATASGKTIKSGVYTAMSGNKDIVMKFPELGGEIETYAKNYDLKFFAKDSETLKNIPTATFEFDGETCDQKKDVAAGSYTLHAYDDNYVAGKVVVELAEVKGEIEGARIQKNIFVYLTQKAEPEPEFIKVNLYGEVRDKRGFIVPAQSIYLTGQYATAAPLYGASTYHFTVEVPAEEKNAVTWTVKAEVINGETTVTEYTRYTYKKEEGITNITKAIQFTAFNIGDDGKVITTPEDIDNGSGSVNPPVDDEGKVTETTQIELTGTNPVTAEKDKTVLIIEKDTEIKDANGEPLAASIVVSRDTEEEKDPSGEVAVEEQVVAIRSYEGFPNGATFSKPILFTFADVYGGDFGSLQLEYLKDGKWINEGEPAVDLAANTYTMKVPHFSKFRAAIKSKMDEQPVEKPKENIETVLVNRMNNNDKAIDVTLTLKAGTLQKGSKYAEPLKDIIAKKFSTEASNAVVRNAIENYFTNKGIIVGDDYVKEDKDIVLSYTVPAYSLLKQARYVIVEKTVKYTFKINNKEVKFDVVTIENIVSKALEDGVDYQVIGHGHSHGHGEDLNAGGGIVEAE